VEVDGRKHCHSTNPISLVHVLFHAFSKLRRPERRLNAATRYLFTRARSAGGEDDRLNLLQ
jgi:hypothetical protein